MAIALGRGSADSVAVGLAGDVQFGRQGDARTGLEARRVRRRRRRRRRGAGRHMANSSRRDEVLARLRSPDLETSVIEMAGKLISTQAANACRPCRLDQTETRAAKITQHAEAEYAELQEDGRKLPATAQGAAEKEKNNWSSPVPSTARSTPGTSESCCRSARQARTSPDERRRSERRLGAGNPHARGPHRPRGPGAERHPA